MQNVKPPPGFTAREARLLLREARSATLSSLLEGGSPYGSLVNLATDRRGRPLLLLSRLAWHTRNLEADGRASLLVVGKGTFSDPLENASASQARVGAGWATLISELTAKAMATRTATRR